MQISAQAKTQPVLLMPAVSANLIKTHSLRCCKTKCAEFLHTLTISTKALAVLQLRKIWKHSSSCSTRISNRHVPTPKLSQLSFQTHATNLKIKTKIRLQSIAIQLWQLYQITTSAVCRLKPNI